MTCNIYAHNEGSEGAKALAGALGVKRLKHVGSKYIGGPAKVVINWGSSTLPANVAKSKVLNHPGVVAAMANKLKFFELMAGNDDVCIPAWTTDINVAKGWLGEGGKVCARAVLCGSGGVGLTIHDKAVDLPKVPLYTRYVPKKAEYRLHYVNGEMILAQKKVRKDGEEKRDVNWEIRNLENGFIFQRNDVVTPNVVLEVGLACFKKSGLDFGAIDIIYNEKHNQAFVLEINTAPGLQGSTVDEYAKAFKKVI